MSRKETSPHGYIVKNRTARNLARTGERDTSLDLRDTTRFFLREREIRWVEKLLMVGKISSLCISLSRRLATGDEKC